MDKNDVSRRQNMRFSSGISQRRSNVPQALKYQSCSPPLSAYGTGNRMIMMSPTARTLKYLRAEGWLAAAVEKWLPRINRKSDLFGVADVLAVHPRDGLFLLVQATSAGHVADRLQRCRSRAELALWLRAGGRFEVWGWGPRGLKRVAVRPEDLAAVVLTAPRPRRAWKDERQRDLFG
jgi:hypothetical protein